MLVPSEGWGSQRTSYISSAPSPTPCFQSLWSQCWQELRPKKMTQHIHTPVTVIEQSRLQCKAPGPRPQAPGPRLGT